MDYFMVDNFSRILNLRHRQELSRLRREARRGGPGFQWEAIMALPMVAVVVVALVITWAAGVA